MAPGHDDSNFGRKAAAAEVQIAQAEAPQFERVNWRKEPHLRKLYAMCIVLMVASATTGYDGFVCPYHYCTDRELNS